jgi:transcriptional regulator with XRE-family HTH domain
MSLTPAQCRAARALISWSQDKLAEASGVAKATIANFELCKRTPYVTTLASLHEALVAAGVEFIPEEGGGAGVRLRKADRPSSAPSEGEAGIIESSDM